MIDGITKRYSTVVIDPPWPASGYTSGGRNGHRGRFHKDLNYPLMSLEHLTLLDIPSVLEDDAFVFLWTINRFIRPAFILLDIWCLNYMCMMAWVKPHGGPKPPGWPQYNMEYILVARRGRPKFLDTKAFRTANVWHGPRNRDVAEGGWGRHVIACAKPEGFYELLRRVTPEPRLDMFARRSITGFDNWGNEAPMNGRAR